jgi:hypothetical protein
MHPTTAILVTLNTFAREYVEYYGGVNHLLDVPVLAEQGRALEAVITAIYKGIVDGSIPANERTRQSAQQWSEGLITLPESLAFLISEMKPPKGIPLHGERLAVILGGFLP